MSISGIVPAPRLARKKTTTHGISFQCRRSGMVMRSSKGRSTIRERKAAAGRWLTAVPQGHALTDSLFVFGVGFLKTFHQPVAKHVGFLGLVRPAGPVEHGQDRKSV